MKNSFRNFIIILNALSALAFVLLAALLHQNTLTGYGLSKVETEKYEDSALFARTVAEDINGIKEYAVLREAFTDGAGVDMDTTVAVIKGDEAGFTELSLGEAIAWGEKYGITYNEEDDSINARKGTNVHDEEKIRVTLKGYDPKFFEGLSLGPLEGVMSRKALVLEILKAYKKYNELDKIYGTEDTNLYYSASFDNMDEDLSFVYNTEKNTEEIRELNKYLIVYGDGRIETNIDPQPEGVLDEGKYFDLGTAYTEDDEAVLSIGIDTDYIYNDHYRAAALNFKTLKNTLRFELVCFMLVSILLIVSFILVIRSTPYDVSNKSLFDKIPIEGALFIVIMLSVLTYLLSRETIYKIYTELFGDRDSIFICFLLKGLCVYAYGTVLSASLYRRAKTVGIAHNCLIKSMTEALFNEEYAHSLLAKGAIFAGVLAVNITGTFFSMYFYIYRFEISGAVRSMVLIIVLVFAFDVFIYLKYYHNMKERLLIKDAIDKISENGVYDKIPETGFKGTELEMAKSLNNISKGLETLINEQVKADKFKADLITNVSHDLKTPLTSIINYVDLIKRETIEDDKLKSYIEVLDNKSRRLKTLTEDLIEASKASSGNIKMNMEKIDIVALFAQSSAEFYDKFAMRKLEFVSECKEDAIYVWADGRQAWRVFENLFNNAAKYALEGTRIYATVSIEGDKGVFALKNVSAKKLNISPDELKERFVRGDESRSTEGSGLGLNIAASLTKLMGGKLDIEIDGDLYKASVILPLYKESKITEAESKEADETLSKADVNGADEIKKD